MVACFVRDEEVVGSNPATPTDAVPVRGCAVVPVVVDTGTAGYGLKAVLPSTGWVLLTSLA